MSEISYSELAKRIMELKSLDARHKLIHRSITSKCKHCKKRILNKEISSHETINETTDAIGIYIRSGLCQPCSALQELSK